MENHSERADGRHTRTPPSLWNTNRTGPFFPSFSLFPSVFPLSTFLPSLHSFLPILAPPPAPPTSLYTQPRTNHVPPLPPTTAAPLLSLLPLSPTPSAPFSFRLLLATFLPPLLFSSSSTHLSTSLKLSITTLDLRSHSASSLPLSLPFTFLLTTNLILHLPSPCP
ncbi:hypothetical protein P152DRAFT_133642 [Eremomyces bilateralis CBS 781.70]|uniref:Uncharacterized protein n=1 Tax=Eremomyces bilateralis CBS 781.70 TaxID=1392243 RepID=A0A6G1GFA6_9PEZI|nr:uncharacterized protein P152DRAFT_133642 [Eremomyces bilateralis CBS 781.70]KAF1816682.1 hypothetical protein P152DRAFT_133642 [Eremomyces bilateralis CBS 781.70]